MTTSRINPLNLSIGRARARNGHGNGRSRGAYETITDQRDQDGGNENQRAGDHVRYRERNHHGYGLRKRCCVQSRAIGCGAEQQLQADQNMQPKRGGPQFANTGKATLQRPCQPEDQAGDDDGSRQVRNDSEGLVAERGAQDQLHKNGCNRGQRERVNRRAAEIAAPYVRLAFPPGAGKERDTRNSREKNLRQCGMCGGDPWRQEKENGETAEQSLSDDGAKSCDTEPAQPTLGCGTARRDTQKPNREHDAEQADEGCDHTVAVLIEDSTDHGWSERAVRKRPIGNREASVIGSDKRPRDEQEERAHGGEDGESVDVLIGARGGHGSLVTVCGLPIGIPRDSSSLRSSE